MLTEKQQTVFDWINDDLELPVFAEAYKGALDYSKQGNHRAILRLYLMHGRDLMNGLASAAIGIPGAPVQYVSTCR